MVNMSELHRKIINAKLRKMEFDIDMFAREVENFAKDHVNYPIPDLAIEKITGCIENITKKPLSSTGERKGVPVTDIKRDEEEDTDVVLERLAKELASLIRETFPSNNLRRVTAVSICYQLGMPSSTRVLFGLCSPLPVKRNRIKKRNNILRFTVK